MKKFLIIQTAFLGDAVLVTSIVEKLIAWYADAEIDLVVRKGNEGLFIGHPFLNRLHVWDKRTDKTRDLLRVIKSVRRTKFDHVINCQRFFSTGLMTVFARGDEKVGYNKNPLSFLFTKTVRHIIGDGRHEVDRLNALIEHLTDGTRPMPELHPEPWALDDIKPKLGLSGEGLTVQYVTIAPASVWFTKQWPESKWIELVKALPKEQKVFIIGAPSDSELAQRIIAATGRGVDLTRELKLLESAALMKGAVMNYVNDSAPLHIASAMNAPVTVVFCSTVPAFGFGPLRENGHVVETNELLACRPCGLHGYKACPKGHFKCALAIDIQRVIGS